MWKMPLSFPLLVFSIFFILSFYCGSSSLLVCHYPPSSLPLAFDFFSSCSRSPRLVSFNYESTRRALSPLACLRVFILFLCHFFSLDSYVFFFYFPFSFIFCCSFILYNFHLVSLSVLSRHRTRTAILWNEKRKKNEHEMNETRQTSTWTDSFVVYVRYQEYIKW